MSKKASADSHSFIVRIWHELTDERGKATAWKGEVVAATTEDGATKKFHEMETLTEFISDKADLRTDTTKRKRKR